MTDSPHELFHILKRTVDAVAPRGAKRCATAMRRIDVAFAAGQISDRETETRDLDRMARVMLRARCRECPSPCETPLV